MRLGIEVSGLKKRAQCTVTSLQTVLSSPALDASSVNSAKLLLPAPAFRLQESGVTITDSGITAYQKGPS